MLMYRIHILLCHVWFRAIHLVGTSEEDTNSTFAGAGNNRSGDESFRIDLMSSQLGKCLCTPFLLVQ